MENTKSSVKKYVFLALVILLVAALTALPFVLDKMNAEKGDGSSILSATVRRADISRTVSGAGTLAAKTATKLTVPEGVVLTGYAVKDGDLVKEGDIVAYVDRVSVYKTATELSETLDSVTEELASVQKVAGKLQTVYSTVVGKVTAVYAEPGSDIRQLMEQYGALAEIELDDGTVLKLTGTSGTISRFYFPVGTYVYVNAPLYAYTDAGGSGSYAYLIERHQKLEEQLAQLFQMYRDGYAVATADGMISGVDETLVKELGYTEEGSLQVKLLANFTQNAPEPVQKISYLSGKLNEDGTVATSDGDLAVEGLDALTPAPSPGDTIIVQCIVYTLEDIPLDDPPPQYIAVYSIPSGSHGGGGGGGMPGGGGFGGGGGGGSFSSGSSMSGMSAEEEESDALATTLIASVVPMDEVLVSITVDELDILSLHKGDKALVTIDALPGRSFEGVVTGVNTGRSNSGGNSKYTAEVTLKRSDDMLAGMNASCLVTIETIRDVLSIPAAALCDEADGCVVYTAVSKDDATLSAPVPVEVGFSDGETVELVSGLSEGDTVWYSTYDTPEYSIPSPGSGPRT